jgi:ABC-type nickel/cobalt efflux system permease component RcnA
MTPVLCRCLLALLLLIGVAPGAPASANPFTGQASSAPEDTPAVSRSSGPIAVIGRALLAFQRESNRLIANHMKAIRDGETAGPLLIGLVLAFAYGVVHALGPGHGKVVVASYFLGREAQIGRGLMMGLQIAVFHVLSAIVVVALADLVLRQAFGSAPAEVAGVRLTSYGLIALIGATMLFQAIRRSRLRRAGIEVGHDCCGHDHGHAHGDHDHGDHSHGGRRAQEGALSLGVGIVPCTGAVLILLYALANDILLPGLLLVVAIAAGMAITMGALGMLSILARNAVATRLEAAGTGGSGAFGVASDYGGAVLITLIGVALFWSAW